MPRTGVTFGSAEPRLECGDSLRPCSGSVEIYRALNAHGKAAPWAHLTGFTMTRFVFLAGAFCALLLCNSCSCGGHSPASNCGGPGEACCTTGTACNSNALCRNN